MDVEEFESRFPICVEFPEEVNPYAFSYNVNSRDLDVGMKHVDRGKFEICASSKDELKSLRDRIEEGGGYKIVVDKINDYIGGK